MNLEKRPLTFGVIAVSCASTTFCIATDASGNAFRFDGTRWSPPVPVSPGAELQFVSCASSTFCMALDSLQQAFAFDGHRWRLTGRDLEASGQRMSGLSCTSRTFCMALGVVGSFTRYNGTSWSTPQFIDGQSPIMTVSCVSSKFCMAVSIFGYAMRYNGTTWSTPTEVSNLSLVSVACVTTSMCVAVDDVNMGTAHQYDGVQWTKDPSDRSRSRVRLGVVPDGALLHGG